MSRIEVYEDVNRSGYPVSVTASRAGTRSAMHVQVTDNDGLSLGTDESPLFVQVDNREQPQSSKIVDADNNPLGTTSRPLYMAHPSEVAVMQGKAFIASSGKVVTSKAENIRVLFNNPAAAGKTLVVNSVAIMNDIGYATWAELFVNPIQGLPNTRINLVKNAIFTPGNSNNATALEVYADFHTTTPIGGVPVAFNLAVSPSRREVFREGVFVVQPGVSIGINLSFKGAGSLEVTIYYREL